jgi:hypothetical protein
VADTVQETRSQKVATDVAALLRSRHPILWIKTGEEARVESYLIEAAGAAGRVPIFWDIAQGARYLRGQVIDSDGDPSAAFAKIRQRHESGTEPNVWIMRDLPVWLQGQPGAVPLRQLRNLARDLPANAGKSVQSIIVLTPSGDVPAELANQATVIDWPLPDRAEIAADLDATMESHADNIAAGKIEPLNGKREAAIDAAVGLTGEEASACFAKSLVQHKRIDPVAVANEKKRIITRERVLEWYDPLPGGLDAIGGLDVLKSWLLQRASAFSIEARAYGLPLPRGLFMTGISGCGKSMTSKAIATAWQRPLLRLDLGALKNALLGKSEENLRKVFTVLEAIGPCVLWMDEVEKSLQGATSGSADGGVAADQLGAILNWMQERQGGAFVVATANDVSALPPELLRKGRFDEVFFIDLPNATERVAILEATLRQYGRPAMDAKALATIPTEEFTGSEVAQLVPEAMFAAFNDGKRLLVLADLIDAARKVVPLSKTKGEQIAALRKWADEGRARRATSVETTSTRPSLRAIDL